MKCCYDDEAGAVTVTEWCGEAESGMHANGQREGVTVNAESQEMVILFLLTEIIARRYLGCIYDVMRTDTVVSRLHSLSPLAAHIL